LLPAVVPLVEVGGDSAELDELVLLELLRQRDVVEVVERVDARLQAVVILLGDLPPASRFLFPLVPDAAAKKASAVVLQQVFPASKMEPTTVEHPRVPRCKGIMPG
jgi:hypothetical protein